MAIDMSKSSITFYVRFDDALDSLFLVKCSLLSNCRLHVVTKAAAVVKGCFFLLFY